MDINRIKSGGYGQDYEVTGDTSVGNKSQTSFPVAGAKTEASAPRKALNAVAQFSKSDLADPGKLDGAIRACVSELVNSGQNLTGRLPAAGKQAVEKFLSSDPSFRHQVESYLQKTLT